MTECCSPGRPAETAQPSEPGPALQRGSRYLPSHLAARLSDPSARAEIEAHLAALLDTVKTYLPRRLRHTLLLNPTPGQVWGEQIQGTLLFADLSGFTNLAASLSQLGLAGAEELVAIVNAIFTTMLEIIEREGGDLLVFGGDALLVLFTAADHPASATRSALQMQQVMASFAHIETGAGTFPLSIHIGVNSGDFLAASVGRAHAMHYILLGHAVEEAAQAEVLAGPGEVVIGRSTAQNLSLGSNVLKPLEGPWFHLVPTAPLPPAPHPQRSPEPENQDWVTALNTLVPYLPAGLLARLVPYPAEPTVEADLKPVAVLFANLLGFETILDLLGPARMDQAVSLLQRYILATQEIAERYGGTVNKVDLSPQGVKLLILFGAPYKHEDDPRRALSVALDMQREMETLQPELAQAGLPPLQQRIGLHTGEVFAGNVGSSWRKEYTVMGTPVNLAARMMAASAPGQIWATEALYTQVGPGCQAQGPHQITVKGWERPLQIYHIQGLHASPRSKSRYPLVGREEEISLLREALESTAQGQGRVVSLVGEAGIGKSRLLEEIVVLAGEKGLRVLSGDTPSYGERIPYTPWDEVLRAVLGWTVDMPGGKRAERLEQRLTSLSPNLTPWAPVMAEALGLSMPETLLTSELDPRLRRQRFFDLTLQLLQSESVNSPLLIVLEDLQWASPLAGELLTYLGRNIARSRVTILNTYRPLQVAQPWEELDNYQQIQLPSLSAASSQDLVTAITGCQALDPALSTLIWERAQGNPLFVEEIMHALQEQDVLVRKNGCLGLGGDAEQAHQAIPTTIQEVVLSRIDRLEEAVRSVLRVASVIDQEFLFPVLVAVFPYPDPEAVLQERVEHLCQIGMLESTGPVQFAFRHALTQEVAYHSMLYARRRSIHARVARHYEEHFQQQLEPYYGFLAHHYRHSDNPPKALEYALKAGRQAAHAYANETANLYFQQALEIAAHHPDSLAQRERVQVRREQGDVLWQAGHFGQALDCYQAGLDEGSHFLQDNEIAEFYRLRSQVYERLGQYEKSLDTLQQAHRVLLRHPQGPSSSDMALVLSNISLAYWRMGAYDEAIGYGEESLAIAQQTPPGRERSRLLGQIYVQQGTVAATTGQYQKAQQYLETGLKFREQAGQRPEIAIAYNNLGFLWQLQDEYQRAIDSYLRCLEVAQQVGDPYIAAYAANNLGSAWYELGDYDLAISYCQESLAVRERIGDRTGMASSWDTLGLVYAAWHEYERALDMHRRSLELKHSLGDTYQEANSLINLAQTHLAQRSFQEALTSGREALELLEQIGVQSLLDEAHITVAEALLSLGQVEKAQTHAETAMDIATTTGGRRHRAVAARVLAEALSANPQGEPGRAETLFQESITQLSALGCRREWARALYSYGGFLRSLGWESKSRQCLAQARQLLEDIGLPWSEPHES